MAEHDRETGSGPVHLQPQLAYSINPRAIAVPRSVPAPPPPPRTLCSPCAENIENDISETRIHIRSTKYLEKL